MPDRIITEYQVVTDEPTFAEPMGHGITHVEKEARESLAGWQRDRPESNPKLQVRTKTISEWRDA